MVAIPLGMVVKLQMKLRQAWRALALICSNNLATCMPVAGMHEQALPAQNPCASGSVMALTNWDPN
jgi:hypothetical protein